MMIRLLSARLHRLELRARMPFVFAAEKVFGKLQNAPCMVISRFSSPMSRMRGHSVFQP